MFFHCGWEDDESGDTYWLKGDNKSQIIIYEGEIGDGEEYACVIHRHIGQLNMYDPLVMEKTQRAENIVAALNAMEENE